MKRKYRADGSLEQVSMFGDDGKIVEVYSYERKDQRLETTCSEVVYNSKNPLLQWKSSAELDAEGNPTSELATEYGISRSSRVVSMERTVNPHDVVSGSLAGQPIVNSIGMPTTSTATVARNPNSTERVTQTIQQDTAKQVGQTEYAHVYDFDSHRNWIKRITFQVKRNGNETSRVPVKVTYRTIVYY